MRICIVTSIFPPAIGGPATYVSELAKRICSRHEVHVVTYGEAVKEKITCKKGAYFVHRVPYPKLPSFIALPLRMSGLKNLIIDIVKENSCDVIYVQDPSIAGIPASKASGKTGKPLVMKFVGDWAWEFSFGMGWTKKFLHDFYDSFTLNPVTIIMEFLQRGVAEKCKTIVVPSKYLKSILKRWGISTMVKVIPNPVERVSKKGKKRCKGSIVTVGRLVKWKNFDILVSVIAELPEKKLTIIGSGPEYKALKNLGKGLGVSGRIRLTGSLPHKRVTECLQSAEIFVLPSLYEGMSHVILEAMQCRIPVIASNVCGNPEIVKDMETGLLIEPRDEEQIKRSIKMLKDKKLKTKVTRNAYKFVNEKNTWGKHIQELEKLFEKVI